MLTGYSALDLTSGPTRLAGSVLAQLGMRVLRPLASDFEAENDPRSWYENAGKELWANAQLEAVRAALPRFEVLLADSTTRDRWEVDVEGLAADPGDAVVCMITPFGLRGPRARNAASELTLQAASGLMWTIGQPDRPPLPIVGSQSAYQGAVRGACAAHARRSPCSTAGCTATRGATSSTSPARRRSQTP